MGGGQRGEVLTCIICHQFPKVVMESKCCFSIFCKKCVMSLNTFTDGDCPTCAKPARGFQLNVPLQRIVDQQEAKCRYQALGCETVLEFKNKEEHEASCQYALMECPLECGTSVLSKDLDEHQESKCPMRRVKCSNVGCEKNMPLALLDIHHRNDCKYVKVQCKQCFKDLVRKGLHEHIDNNCPETLVTCPYHECGCCEQIPRKLLLSHLDKNTKLHLQLVLKIVGKQQHEIASLKRELNNVKNQKVSLSDSLQAFADNTLDSTMRWMSEPVEPNWLPKIQFNLMYIWFFELFVLMLLMQNGIFFKTQQYLAMTTFCIFMGYFYLVHQMPNISWYLKLIGSLYFNIAWAFLLYICI